MPTFSSIGIKASPSCGGTIKRRSAKARAKTARRKVNPTHIVNKCDHNKIALAASIAKGGI